ncbi:hypothetical protein NDU88_002488 [Pleurodeles waltl]|uniref:Uncharacterized protein n=1 Tax=Pleurodeles waltl TaxID=8319 RepID=A0AAV7MXJ9_PLEWA|nr:hypothetical protein NDU88_002488 [Pleurodeles waltl]
MGPTTDAVRADGCRNGRDCMEEHGTPREAARDHQSMNGKGNSAPGSLMILCEPPGARLTRNKCCRI